MTWNNQVFLVRGPVEMPISLTIEDIFDGVVDPSRQGTDRLSFDITSLRDIITGMGFDLAGLTPVP